MTTQSITSGQKDQIVKFGADAVRGALKDVGMDKGAAQRIIAGGEFQRRIGEAARQALRDLGSDKATTAFPVWKTITIGGQNNIAAYRAALHAGGYRVGDYASQLLDKTVVAESETTLELVRLTVGEMGFPRGASTAEIYAWAEAHGLKKCPAEVGPALRLAYADQPYGEWIRVGMEPIADSVGDLHVFLVGHGDHGRWLGTHWTDPTNQWHPGYVWVFLRSKQ